ncbi:hypothetical protein BCR44DRAFT_1448321 [Catenaria anguillulae PL171]|uniref:UspA domain-containing protein n=1 Tax=Catenaria anguillulae PL171 TaxID=765915 RepID=A0A1Y2H520_9FUNG|nr:hypothetical protein BCR44DRAFT_1448321 [Catenaria anguillulae PL171]
MNNTKHQYVPKMLSSNPQSNMLAVPSASTSTSTGPASVASTAASNTSVFSASTTAAAGSSSADDWASTASLPPSLINLKEPFEEHVMEQLQEHHLIDHSTPASVPHSPTTQAPRTLLELANREAAHRLLADAGNWLKAQHPTVQVKAVAIRGEPRSDIVRKAQDVDADMIVVGSRGLGALKRVVMGSVSEYVCNHAACPVLVVRPKHCGKEKEKEREVGLEPGPGEQGPSAAGTTDKKTPGEEVPVHLLSRAAEEE